MKLVAEGTVSMAGTYSANGIAVAAANAALDELASARKIRGAVCALHALLRRAVARFSAAWLARLCGRV